MKISKIEYRAGLTVQTKQFENIRPEVMVEATLDGQDDPEKVKQVLRVKVQELLDELAVDMFAAATAPKAPKVASPQPVSFGAPQPPPPHAQTPHWSEGSVPPQQPAYQPHVIPTVDPKTW